MRGGGSVGLGVVNSAVLVRVVAGDFWLGVVWLGGWYLFGWYGSNVGCGCWLTCACAGISGSLLSGSARSDMFALPVVLAWLEGVGEAGGFGRALGACIRSRAPAVSRTGARAPA